LAEPGKEIEITTSKLTTMCLKNQQFQPMCAYKLRAYKKNKVYSLFFLFVLTHRGKKRSRKKEGKDEERTSAKSVLRRRVISYNGLMYR